MEASGSRGQKCGTSGYGSSTFKHRDQCTAGMPRISDVYLMEKILKYLGAETWWEGQDLYLDCSHADGTMIPEYYSGKMRSSVILMGAMLGRSKRHRQDIPAAV